MLIQRSATFVAGCLAAAAASNAFAQTTVLKNDHFPSDVSTVADAQMTIEAGFAADEVGVAVLSVPSVFQHAFKVTHVQIMWASTAPGTVAPSDQGSIMIYKGSVLQAGSQLVFDSANDAAGGDGLTPQMQDGGLNDFDFSGENILIQDATKISVGLQFATATNQTSGPSLCTDRPPTGNVATAGLNAIYGTAPPFINSATWFDPGTTLGMHGNFFIRAVIESAADCPADLGMAGGFAGQDGVLDNNDFIMFINYFFTNNTIADIGSVGGVAGADGLFDNNDFIVFIDRFFAGCS